MTGDDMLKEVQEILVDRDGDTYRDADGLKWINDAQRAVALVKPEATSSYITVPIVAGETRQALPSNVRRLLGVTRNMGVLGNAPGRPIRGPIRLETLNSVSPFWHGNYGEYVREYAYVEEVHNSFFVVPAPAVDMHVEIIASRFPGELNVLSDSIELNDIYLPPMREWVLYLFLARDQELSPNMQRAAMHFQAFFNLLQVKLQSDMRVRPSQVERPVEAERAR